MSVIEISLYAEQQKAVEVTVARLERMHKRRDIPFSATWGTTYKKGRMTMLDLRLEIQEISNDWDFLFSVSPADPNEPHGSLAVVRQNPTMNLENLSLPEIFEDHCDHCTSGRRGRHNIMVMRHKETDEIVNVGSSCLLEYAGVDPEIIMSVLKFKEQSVGGGGLRRHHDTMSAYEFALRASLFMHSKTPYRKGTGQKLFSSFLVRIDEKIEFCQIGPSGYYAVLPVGGIAEITDFTFVYRNHDELPKTLAPSVITMAHEFMAWCETLSGSTSFEHSVRSIFKSGVVSQRNANFAGGAISGYLRHLSKPKTVVKTKKSGKHLGQVGSRIQWDSATVTFIRRIEGYYGISTLTKFKVGEDFIVWFRSGDKDDLEVGDTVSLTGTVKKHDNYGDEKQTIITRGKIKEEGV